MISTAPEPELTPQDPAPHGAGADLRAHGERIERLLSELRAMVGPPAWQRVEELMRLVVELYGAGLERVLRHASEAGGDRPALEARLCEDELVSSLLLLHGLHPIPTAARVRRAVDALRARLGAGVELLEPGTDGVVRVRLPAAGAACPSSQASLARAIEDAVQEAAPEVVRVEVDARPSGLRQSEDRRSLHSPPLAATSAARGPPSPFQGEGDGLVTIGPPRGR